MPTVTINGRTLEVPAGTNVIEAAKKVGVQIPHYCYHPRLSIVGQCRMCLVQVDGHPKLQAGCSMTVQRDGMDVRTDVVEVEEAQRAMMEFLLINHPLDCSICDQAGECGLQDYSFKHGQSYSRFQYEEKRTYPGRERIPLGPTVLLNMNRCIQCTRCVRFTQEVSKTGSLGFFNRGARTEIGTFPGKRLDDELAGNVVDICPVGALTSTQFRFAERVWYLTKRPSLCTGCEVGCNITLEHRKGAIRRYKPRYNPEVNDHWMCDPGRISHLRYDQLPRLQAPRLRRREDGAREGNGAVETVATSWMEALDAVHRALTTRSTKGSVAFLGSAHLTTEEAWLLAQIADRVGSPHRDVHVEEGPRHTIPTPNGDISGVEAGPNRRGAQLAGLRSDGSGLGARQLLDEDGAAGCAVLFVAGSDLGKAASDPETVARLRRAGTLIVLGWADTPLAQAADIALPMTTHAETDGTFVNVQWRLQRFERAFPAPAQVLSGVEVLSDLLARFDEGRGGAAGAADDGYEEVTPASVFDRMAAQHEAFGGLTWKGVPPTGTVLAVPEAREETRMPAHD